MSSASRAALVSRLCSPLLFSRGDRPGRPHRRRWCQLSSSTLCPCVDRQVEFLTENVLAVLRKPFNVSQCKCTMTSRNVSLQLHISHLPSPCSTQRCANTHHASLLPLCNAGLLSSALALTAGCNAFRRAAAPATGKALRAAAIEEEPAAPKYPTVNVIAAASDASMNQLECTRADRVAPTHRSTTASDCTRVRRRRATPAATLTSHRAQGWTADESKFMAGLPGALPPMGNFDPAGFTEGKSVAELKMLREAEVTHGRVSMLASLGFLVQESFHPLFRLGDKDIGPAIRHLDEVRAEVPIFFEILVLGIGFAEISRSLAGWTAPAGSNPADGPLANLPADTPFRRLEDKYYPGDIGFDPAGLKPSDPKEFAAVWRTGPASFRFDVVAAMASAWPSEFFLALSVVFRPAGDGHRERAPRDDRGRGLLPPGLSASTARASSGPTADEQKRDVIATQASTYVANLVCQDAS